MVEDESGRAILESVFGNSPYLSHGLLADLEFARTILIEGPEIAFDSAMAALHDEAGAVEDTTAAMRRLRVAKMRVALLTALADIAGGWALERVSQALSDFASSALSVAAAHLLHQAAAAGDLALPDPDQPERDSGFVILGLGKLGAHELNYSSDIDLIVMYDDERIHYTGPDHPQPCFVRMTRELVRMMAERTSDGYVFRTDLRLRPDPGATPLAISMLAAETYYESTGQNWERAAMIKARPVAGDLAAGEAFVKFLSPFIWRKSLDFAAIQDIHSIKRQINAHRGGSNIAVAGHNLKLGRGGIREIEFFAQTQQLIWGGREPGLRSAATCATLEALADHGHVDAEAAQRLIEAYRYLRRLEHRLQMIDDEQTHTLPTDEAALGRVAAFMGAPNGDAFAEDIMCELKAVETHYAALFETAPDLGGPGNLVFTGADDDPDTIETLARLGYRDGAAVSAAIRGWHHGRPRATRSTRTKELLTELMPALLKALARTANPDTALFKFDAFLARLPADVQLFSLFHAQPGLLDLVAEIMGSAPRLAEWLSRYPILLDGVLSADFYDPLPPVAELKANLSAILGRARDFQDVLDAVRRWSNDRIFQVGVQVLRGKTGAEDSGAPLTAIADAALRQLLPIVEEEFAQSHGRIPGDGMAVAALGKLGGEEMTVGSDLDLLFIYGTAAEEGASDGARPLAPSQYYARLCQRYINAITAPTPEGKLFEVDMRLRPSGNAGPIATSLDAFVKYHHGAAWTWEHMALTRARVVAGPPELSRTVEAAIRDVLTQERDPGKLVHDVADMRARIARERGADNLWEVKHLAGGIIDVEFIAQYLELRHAHERPEILSRNTTKALDRLARFGFLDRGAAEQLIAALHLWRRVQAILRLTHADGFDEDAAPEGVRVVMARAANTPDFAALKANIIATASRVRRHFANLIEVPAKAYDETDRGHQSTSG